MFLIILGTVGYVTGAGDAVSSELLLIPALMLLAVCGGVTTPTARAAQSFSEVVVGVQPKIVKIYGAGGGRGLEAYQTGILISADGHVLTVWSYVLDSDSVRAVLADGRAPASRGPVPHRI